MTRLPSALRILGAGLGLAVATPPIGLWPAAPIGLALLVLELRGRRYRERFAVVAATFVVHYVVTLSWVWSLHPAALLLIPILAALDALVLAAAPPSGRGREV
ncbi:MAG: hypothetical protein AAGA17_16535, partial [Actinomycetota bacterium]